ncbi:hypothetical protein O181_013114 [Austropuccinia psidii MF-1]|uniref:Uncharacterized protein n=1 Tax=Austropuccinia psidii MF-1 TaxID=1389203 RepID=A0A9Q3BVU1_9BASI|nr:hypothetical protein [Austropuccinia psidii MF-1]
MFSEATHLLDCIANALHLVSHEGLKDFANGAIAKSEKENESATPMDPPEGFNIRYDPIILSVVQFASYLKNGPQKGKKFATTVKLISYGPNFSS